jgi:prepilin-type N-terminal cleavage/methylation domain-containing protein
MAGFTLVELAITVSVIGILSAYAMMKLMTPGTLTLPTQAQAVAAFIRRAQVLAVNRGQQMKVSVATTGANGTLAIACSSGTTPCTTDASLTVGDNIVVGSASAMYFNSLGLPVNSAGTALTTNPSYTLSFTTGSTTATETITVSTLTGRVSVTP